MPASTYFETQYESHFADVSQTLERAFRALERCVPPPQWVYVNGSRVPRYVEKTARQAIVQKLARYLSGLNALSLLVSNGFGQEQAVIQRTLDEIAEDIMFLQTDPTTADDIELRDRYLNAFYQEEFDEGVPTIASNRTRYPVRRRLIRTYLARHNQNSPYSHEKISEIISRAYSGFVHAASPHIMDMWGEEDDHFHVSGLIDPNMRDSHADDAWNYFFRGILTVASIAAYFGKPLLAESLIAKSEEAERFSPHQNDGS